MNDPQTVAGDADARLLLPPVIECRLIGVIRATQRSRESRNGKSKRNDRLIVVPEEEHEICRSIRSLADRFPPDTVVYSGHGPPTTIGAELEGNPFLAELRAS